LGRETQLSRKKQLRKIEMFRERQSKATRATKFYSPKGRKRFLPA